MAFISGMNSIIWEYEDDFNRTRFPTFLTNTQPRLCDIYTKAAEVAGVDLYISDDAYDSRGNRCDWLKAVHIRNMPADLSKFWRIFDKMKKEAA